MMNKATVILEENLSQCTSEGLETLKKKEKSENCASNNQAILALHSCNYT